MTASGARAFVRPLARPNHRIARRSYAAFPPARPACGRKPHSPLPDRQSRWHALATVLAPAAEPACWLSGWRKDCRKRAPWGWAIGERSVGFGDGGGPGGRGG